MIAQSFVRRLTRRKMVQVIAQSGLCATAQFNRLVFVPYILAFRMPHWIAHSSTAAMWVHHGDFAGLLSCRVSAWLSGAWSSAYLLFNAHTAITIKYSTAHCIPTCGTLLALVIHHLRRIHNPSNRNRAKRLHCSAIRTVFLLSIAFARSAIIRTHKFKQNKKSPRLLSLSILSNALNRMGTKRHELLHIKIEEEKNHLKWINYTFRGLFTCINWLLNCILIECNWVFCYFTHFPLRSSNRELRNEQIEKKNQQQKVPTDPDRMIRICSSHTLKYNSVCFCSVRAVLFSCSLWSY